jgi:hypothetical protein
MFIASDLGNFLGKFHFKAFAVPVIEFELVKGKGRGGSAAGQDIRDDWEKPIKVNGLLDKTGNANGAGKFLVFLGDVGCERKTTGISRVFGSMRILWSRLNPSILGIRMSAMTRAGRSFLIVSSAS